MLSIVTLSCLLLLLAAAIGLRLRWSSLSRRFRSRLLIVVLVLAALGMANTLTGWDTTSARLDALLPWLRIGGYLLLLAFLTTLRPRWLTVAIAVVLLLPLFASSFFAPLTDLFNPREIRQVPFGRHFVLETAPWSSGAGENSGVDFILYAEPPWQSLFRRGFKVGRLYNSQCQTATAVASFDPRRNEITIRCLPLHPESPTAADPGTTLQFPLR